MIARCCTCEWLKFELKLFPIFQDFVLKIVLHEIQIDKFSFDSKMLRYWSSKMAPGKSCSGFTLLTLCNHLKFKDRTTHGKPGRALHTSHIIHNRMPHTGSNGDVPLIVKIAKKASRFLLFAIPRQPCLRQFKFLPLRFWVGHFGKIVTVLSPPSELRGRSRHFVTVTIAPPSTRADERL